MSGVRQYILFRGLEHPFIVCYDSDTSRFDIQEMFSKFGQCVDHWLNEARSPKTEHCEADDELYLCQLSLFLKALGFCSLLSRDKMLEISCVLYLFTGNEDRLWLEQELSNILEKDMKLTLPTTQEFVDLQNENERLKHRITFLERRTRMIEKQSRKRMRDSEELTTQLKIHRSSGVVGDIEASVESATRLLEVAKSHIVIVPITRKKDAVVEDEDDSTQSST